MEPWGSLPRLQHPFPDSYFKSHEFSTYHLLALISIFILFSHLSLISSRINTNPGVIRKLQFQILYWISVIPLTVTLLFAEPPDTRLNFNNSRLLRSIFFPVHRSWVIFPCPCFYSSLKTGDKISFLKPFWTGNMWSTQHANLIKGFVQPFSAQGLLYALPALTLRKSEFCPQSVSMYFVTILTINSISPYIVTCLVVITKSNCESEVLKTVFFFFKFKQPRRVWIFLDCLILKKKALDFSKRWYLFTNRIINFFIVNCDLIFL